MARSFDNVDNKVAEADFFLEQLLDEKNVHPVVGWHLSAFVSAARSITFALQAVLSDTPGFTAWYAARETQLKADPLARYFLELRNFSQKTGAMVVNRSYGPAFIALLKFKSLKSRPRHWFGHSGENMPEPPAASVGEAAQTYFRTLLRIVYDCYVDFGPFIDPQQHYTPEHFASIGKTIDDAEAELGFPRGWTALKDNNPADIPYRFELLRNHAAGCCGINPIFEKHLNLTTPMPARLPDRRLPEDEGWSTLPSGGRVWIPKEFRKTGTAAGDLAAYIESLKELEGG